MLGPFTVQPKASSWLESEVCAAPGWSVRALRVVQTNSICGLESEVCTALSWSVRALRVVQPNSSFGLESEVCTAPVSPVNLMRVYIQAWESGYSVYSTQYTTTKSSCLDVERAER